MWRGSLWGNMKVCEGGVENSCGMEVSKGGMENSCGMEVLEAGVEYSGVMEVSLVERPTAQPPSRRPPRLPTRPGQQDLAHQLDQVNQTSPSPSTSDLLHPNCSGRRRRSYIWSM